MKKHDITELDGISEKLIVNEEKKKTKFLSRATCPYRKNISIEEYWR